jgi:hypothetical protein
MKLGTHTISFPYIMAPMAGYTDLPFRLLVRDLGCQLAYTEMVSAEGLVRHLPETWTLLKTVPKDHPLSVQLFGARTETMSQAARLVEEAGADIIDINMGCPVRKVNRSGSGAALLKNLKQAEEIIKAVRKAVRIPLTIKIRLGWKIGDRTYETLARLAEGAFFGEMAFFTNAVRTASVETTVDTTLLRINRKDLGDAACLLADHGLAAGPSPASTAGASTAPNRRSTTSSRPPSTRRSSVTSGCAGPGTSG